MLRQASGRLAFILLCLITTVYGQESATPEPIPTPKPRSVRLTFLPPPLDGSISLGIYDSKGKLVRVLYREADLDQFSVGADALVTAWDGKDDRGDDVPAGKYRAHGFVVGDVAVEGVGFFFNDWITAEDSPRISRIRSLALHDNKLHFGADLVPDRTVQMTYDIMTKSLAIDDNVANQLTPSPAPPDPGSGATDPVLTVAGRDGTRWVIDRTDRSTATTELKQFSAQGEYLRRLTAPADQPQPVAVAPSMLEDKIYLLEENNSVQRLRGLTLVASKAGDGQQPVSDWKVDFEKSIVAHRDFSIAGGKPVVAARPGNLVATLKVRLQPNPLLNDERITVDLAAGFDAEGSFLKTADGLPLLNVSETAGLIRAILTGRGSNGLDFFQDDSAVVEQFRVTGLDRMMSFDCGSFELK